MVVFFGFDEVKMVTWEYGQPIPDVDVIHGSPNENASRLKMKITKMEQSSYGCSVGQAYYSKYKLVHVH